MINKERLYSRFMELCAIDSEPTRERLLADRLTQLLEELGFTVREDDAGAAIGGTAGNLLATLPGTRAAAPLLFSCHLDRVTPGVGVKPRMAQGFMVSDGTTVLGADDGAGLAALVEALTTIRERRLPHPPLELVLSVAEELALLGARHLDTGRILSRSAFVLDAAGSVGEIVIQAPEQVKFQAVFHGRSAHAGFSPEQGISAIQIAALAICRMKLLRVDPETTANIGSISAVGPTNIIPDRCELQGEVRSLDAVKLQHQIAALTAAMESAAAEYGGSVEIVIQPCYPSYRLTEDADPAQRAARAARRLGVPVRFKPTGGGSDANIFNHQGIPTVVLSCGYEKAHTTEERIALEQLDLLAGWVVEIITEQGSPV